jgi:hypothetical protein
MHRGHDHHDHHHHNGGGDATHGRAQAGHNHITPPRPAAQWQTPHLPDAVHTSPEGEPDLDLVEAAFVEAFAVARDPTSFLRLAQVPFEATDPAGTKLVLLRVETNAVTDIGAVMPHLGGETMRYDPLPARLVSQRRRLRFIYFDGTAPRALELAQVRGLVAT